MHTPRIADGDGLRHSLASERQHHWQAISRGAPDAEHRRRRVRELTSLLNGHAAELGDREKPGGGFYADKRHANAAAAAKLERSQRAPAWWRDDDAFEAAA